MSYCADLKYAHTVVFAMPLIWPQHSCRHVADRSIQSSRNHIIMLLLTTMADDMYAPPVSSMYLPPSCNSGIHLSLMMSLTRNTFLSHRLRLTLMTQTSNNNYSYSFISHYTTPCFYMSSFRGRTASNFFTLRDSKHHVRMQKKTHALLIKRLRQTHRLQLKAQ
jgi:hypothetical protein